VYLLAPTAALNTAGQPKLNVLFLFADGLRADATATTVSVHQDTGRW
jgi:hypothetical protein